MMSFRDPTILRACVPVHVAKLVSKIDENKGRQELYATQSPQVLRALRQVAMVQSTESSNRIEGITAPHGKIAAIVAEKAEPSNRSEAELAGYRDVLSTIHSSYDHIPLTPNTILQLHRDLYAYVPSEGGRWKSVDNTIDDVLPDGTHVVRFRPVSVIQTPGAVSELCGSLKAVTDSQEQIPLLTIGAFVFDFLCIHPFRDGNGRMSRLLSLLLLYRSGYEVGRYIGLERVVEQTKQTYYDSLAASGQGWHEGKHSLLPWWEHFLGCVLSAYRELDERVGAVTTGRGSKTRLVRSAVESLAGDFSVADVVKKCPTVSKDMVRSVLDKMKRGNEVECLGRGRGAKWRRV